MNPEPRANRADLQTRQAAHRHPPASAEDDLVADPAAALARAARPDLIGHLLCRAADQLPPTGPAPVITPETDEADQ